MRPRVVVATLLAVLTPALTSARPDAGRGMALGIGAGGGTQIDGTRSGGLPAEPPEVVGQPYPAYWTAERMRRAQLVDSVGAAALARAGGTAAAASRNAARAAATAPPAIVQAVPLPAAGPVARAVGRVFFTMRGHDFSCSGAVVAAHNRDTVITAGHCLCAGPGPCATNWIFVPGYRNGSNYYGAWTARRLVASASWIATGTTSEDVGFAVLNLARGQHIADAVGALPVAFGRPRGGYVRAIGYPVALPAGGRVPLECQGRVRQDRYGTGAQGLACSMTAGASGGPWLLAGPGRLATVCGVTSFTYGGIRNVIWAPYLGPAAARLFHQAEAS